MDVAIYLIVPSDTTTQTHSLIQAGRDAAGEEYQHIKFFALDIEGDKLLHPTDPKARLSDAIHNAGVVDRLEDRPVVIYTSVSKWKTVMDNAPGFNYYPLWDARYDELPDLDANWVPYGGWEGRAIKQYSQNRIVAGGISADLNVVHLGRLFGTSEPPSGYVDAEDWEARYEGACVLLAVADENITKLEAKITAARKALE